METLLVMQDPAVSVNSGSRPGSSGKHQENGLFSSTLSKEMKPQGSASGTTEKASTTGTKVLTPAATRALATTATKTLAITASKTPDSSELPARADAAELKAVAVNKDMKALPVITGLDADNSRQTIDSKAGALLQGSTSLAEPGQQQKPVKTPVSTPADASMLAAGTVTASLENADSDSGELALLPEAEPAPAQDSAEAVQDSPLVLAGVVPQTVSSQPPLVLRSAGSSPAVEDDSEQTGLPVTSSTSVGSKANTLEEVTEMPNAKGEMGYLQSILNRFSSSRNDASTAPPALADSSDSDGNSLQDDGKILPPKLSRAGTGNTAATTDSIQLPKFFDTGKNQSAMNLASLFPGFAATEMAAGQNQADTIRVQLAAPGVLAGDTDSTALQQLSLTQTSSAPASISTAAPATAAGDTRGLFGPNHPFAMLHSELPAGSEGWNEDLGAKITWLSNQKIGKAEISLHPAELGALDITIDNDNDRITVSIVTRNDAARELLESSMPRLSELLRNNGLALEQGSVSQHTASSGQGNTDSGLTRHGSDSSETGSDMQGSGEIRLRASSQHNGQIDHYV